MPQLKVYSYDRFTGEYIGGEFADVSPLEPDKWLIPAWATAKAPPPFEQGKRPIYSPETDDWVMEDIPPAPYAAPEQVDATMTIGDLFNAY